MNGGDYFTWFNEDGSGLRKILYFLENLGIVVIRSRTLGKEDLSKEDQIPKGELKELLENNEFARNSWKKGDMRWSERQWILTKKGKAIVEKDENLQRLQKEGDALKFFMALKDKVEEREFFIP